MAEKNNEAFGIYPHRASFKYALNALKIAGYRETEISVLLQRNPRTKDLARKRAANAPEGTATGAGSEAVIEGAQGWWTGTGALAARGFGPLLIAGPMVGTLAGKGAGDTPGGLADALLGLGIPEYEAKRYQGRIENGGVLLSLRCDSPNGMEKAKRLLSATGAEDISSTGESAAG
jgi:hypothetical protein